MDDEGLRGRKRAQRRHLLRLREGLGEECRTSADAAIRSNVLELPEYQHCKVLLSYLSVGCEVDTRPLIEDALSQGKVVALPRCIPGTRRMAWYQVLDLDGLVRSPFGLEEPLPRESARLEPEGKVHSLALVPGLGFDVRGNRLGYGGGFYDVFLSSYAGITVGLCRSPQLCEQGLLAVGELDRRVRIVASDVGVIRIS